MHEKQILVSFRAILHFAIFCSKPQLHDKLNFWCILNMFEDQVLVQNYFETLWFPSYYSGSLDPYPASTSSEISIIYDIN